MGVLDVRPSGKGHRSEYWPEHVAMVAVAFELLRFRVPQTAVAAAVAGHGDVVLDAVGRAARRSLRGDGEGPLLLTVASNALREDAQHPDFADVAIAAVDGLAEAARVDSSTTMVVDVAGLVARVVAGAASTDEPFGCDFLAGLGLPGAERGTGAITAGDPQRRRPVQRP